MSNFMNKMLNFVGFDAVDEYDDDYYEENDNLTDDYEEEPVMQANFSSRRNSRVVKLHQSTQTQMKLVVMQPESFEEARDIANHLKSRKPVIMNLESVEKGVARRIVDFLSGAVYALDGNIQKVSNGIFLIAPYNVDVMSDTLTSHANAYPWDK